MSKVNFSWLTKMAWRDSRRNRSRLILFISSIVLGIAALVAINSFSENLLKDIGKEAKSLLGADFTLESNQPLDSLLIPAIDTIAEDQSRSVDFVSMVFFLKMAEPG